MRTSVTLRTLAAALLTGGTLGAVASATPASAAPATTPVTTPASAPASSYASGDSGDRRPVWGTVTSATALNVRAAPTTHSTVVDRLAPGSRERVQCAVTGQSVNGTATWYWLPGSQGWASAAFVGTGRHQVPDCADPCPVWKDGSGWTNGGWTPDGNGSGWTWSSTGSGSDSGSFHLDISVSVSGSWS